MEFFVIMAVLNMCSMNKKESAEVSSRKLGSLTDWRVWMWESNWSAFLIWNYDNPL
jgi:hypothetical protein